MLKPAPASAAYQREDETPAQLPEGTKSARSERLRFSDAEQLYIRQGTQEAPDFVPKLLAFAGKGPPGLSEERRPGRISVFSEELVIAYRNSRGEPIAAATVVEVSTLADLAREIAGQPPIPHRLSTKDIGVDHSAGLLAGRALLAVIERLKDLNAITPLNRTSAEARRLQVRLSHRRPYER